MRRVLAAVVAVLSLVLGAAAPASATHDFRASHWGRYSWGGTPQMDGRSFYLFDRLSDPTAKSALQEWVQAYNNDLIRRGLYGWLPAIALVDDPYSVGQCGYLWFRGYSLATICSRDEGSLGLAHFGMEGAHNEDIQPWVSIRPGVDYNTAFSVICAEMGHLLGLGHQPNNSGSCSVAATPYGQKRYYNEHDFQELLAIYGHYW